MNFEPTFMKSISGTPLHELEKLLSPLPPFRARQIFDWIHRGALSFNDMTNLSQNLRNELSQQFCLRKTKILNSIEDNDGTIKIQLGLEDGSMIESVILIDGSARKTACLSTQVGCPMACVFCKTGSLGFSRNLDSAEIVEQLLHIYSLIHNKTHKSLNSYSKSKILKISNIVFMGMGEPLLNLYELEKAFSVICDQISGRRITVSTCGIIKGILKMADSNLNVRIAISLTTADEALRQRLMPVTTQNSLAELKKALQYYQEKQNQRITLECVLLGGLNTRQEDIQALCRFSKGLDVIVNLISWNPIEKLSFEGKPLKEPSVTEVKNFEKSLNNCGLKTSLRFRKGLSVGGACGQLGAIGLINKPLTPCKETSIENILCATY